MTYATYIDQPLLKKLNDKAIRQDRNRTLRPSFVKSIDKDLRMPLVADMPHNDREMRCVFLFVEKTSCSRPSQNILFRDPEDSEHNSVELWLDMAFDDWISLPRAEI
jgi:hypothetical protein